MATPPPQRQRIATSGEGYSRKHNAWKGLRSVMANSSNAEIVNEPSG
nr:DUF1508 domain-containing protein [Haloplanus sp. XH21]